MWTVTSSRLTIIALWNKKVKCGNFRGISCNGSRRQWSAVGGKRAPEGEGFGSEHRFCPPESCTTLGKSLLLPKIPFLTLK